MARRSEEIKVYLSNVTQNPRMINHVVNGKRVGQRVTPEFILKWAEDQSKAGKRIIFIDPLAQISFDGFKRWEQEETFVQELCAIAQIYKNSLVMVSHTRKGNGDSDDLSVEDMQGSAAFGRLCHTSILIGATHDMQIKDISRPEGKIEKCKSNRTVVIGAARNGAGTRSKLAYAVEPGSPIFNEIGYLSNKKEGKQ